MGGREGEENGEEVRGEGETPGAIWRAAGSVPHRPTQSKIKKLLHISHSLDRMSSKEQKRFLGALGVQRTPSAPLNHSAVGYIRVYIGTNSGSHRQMRSSEQDCTINHMPPPSKRRNPTKRIPHIYEGVLFLIKLVN